MRIGGTGRIAAAGASLIVLALLSACGGGGTSSTPTPTTTTVPTPTPTATPAPAVNYNTSEYRASTGPSFHGAITAYQAGASGAGITVGVIDSGIADPTGELTGRLSSASRDFAGNANITDVDGHGTAVTMAIAAGRNDRAILGVAWGSTVLTLRTDTTSGCTGTSQFCFTTTAIANALDYAVSNGARVVNISLGGQSATNFLRQAVNRATAAGTIIIVSAGNDHTAAPDPLAQSLADPAISHGLVIIAAAVDQNGGQASFSNGAQGFENTTLSALGVGVTTLDQNGILSSWSGTSLSAPLISGAAALIAQAFPNLTSTQIVQLLLSSATDAGATGADAVYGAGILDLARAFAPQGSLSLAGSTTALSLASTSSLSPAMGDAALAGQSISGVATDRLGRAYGVDLGAGLRAAVPGLRLAPSLRTGIANLSVGTKNTRIALSLTGGQESGASLRRLTLSEEQAQGARLLAAQIAARIAPGTDIAFGLATGSAPLRAMLDDIDNPPFLIARDDSLLTSDLRADRAMRLRQAIGHGLSLSVTAEQGRIAADDRTDANHLGGWRDQDRYAALGLGLSWSHGPLMLSAGATRVAESGTALGARFAPVFGAQSATTAIASLSARLTTGGWTVTGDWRRGWTHAAAGGALRSGGQLTSEAWSITAGRSGVLMARDSLSLGLARPLRVIASDFRLTLPTAYDYASGSATTGTETLDLVPRGREQDMELAYARPLGDGWLTVNLYRREQAGNIAGWPDDMGGAMRFDLRF